MDFVNKGSLTVIPVFHNVNPCHVRRQIGQVALQFKKHEKREDHEKVLSWRQALTTLANISGYCSRKSKDESTMVENIAEKISMLIRTRKTRSNERTDGHMEDKQLLVSARIKLVYEVELLRFGKDKSEGCCSVQLIDGDGIYNVSGIDHFIKEVKLGECGLSYAVVSIMGPQSSGKSTLLNSLFGTNFMEMDAFKGRYDNHLTVFKNSSPDLELSIGPRPQKVSGLQDVLDDTAFEKQSALFALAISDIVLINMWCHDIGREQAANKPLLKTVFQVMMRLFSPRKTTMLFVIRDKTRTPLENLEPVLREDIQKIWDSVPKPEAHKETPMSDFFNSLKLLSVMVVIRLGDETDNIEKTLSVALLDPTTSKKSITASDPLASSTWDEIPSSRTLITPVQCKSIWRQFKTETEYTEANKRGSNWLPPPWAILALILLGFNEFMTLLRNPLYLGLLFVGFLLLKALWTQLDIPGEFRNGVVPGLISISAKFVPTVMNLLKNLAAEGEAPPTANPENRRPSNNTSSHASSSENPTEHKSGSKTD
ncbi:hypothetical protein YC2023_092725 [Brassica napus]